MWTKQRAAGHAQADARRGRLTPEMAFPDIVRMVGKRVAGHLLLP
jgi:hypothetical protein